MISASLITAIFVLILISTIIAIIGGKPATLRFASLVCILFGWSCPVLAIISIFIAVVWGILIAIFQENS